MGKAVDRIVEMFNDVFGEETWQVPVKAAVAGLTARQADWKPAPERNSIWQIVDHLTLWKDYYASRLAGEPPRREGWAKELDWREIEEPTDENWQRSVKRLHEAHAHLVAEFAKRSDEDLERPILGGQTYPLYSLQLQATHDTYHCGQICYLRALQGIPAKGSWDE